MNEDNFNQGNEIDKQDYITAKLILKNIILFIVIILLIFLVCALYNSKTVTIAKPIIYLYPEEETQVNVKVVYEDKLTHTYPKYTSKGWDVIAKPNGDLEDLDTGRYLYSLYYEAKDNPKLDMSKGFVVKGEDTIIFLEEKLELLGLNEREAQEFIVYWLPKMENNKYNFVYFLTTEELDEIMPLDISPEPDTSIRILMLFKGLENKIEVEEQEIVTPERKGFTIVEWGGTEYLVC